MKILFFTRALPCHSLGGMEIVAWDMATGLTKRGHNVKIITTGTNAGHICAIPGNLSSGLDITHLPGTPPRKYSRAYWRRSRQAFFQERMRLRPDIVFSVSAGALSVLSYLDGIPAIVQLHGISWAEARSKFKTRKFISYLGALYNLSWIVRERPLYKYAAKIV